MQGHEYRNLKEAFLETCDELRGDEVIKMSIDEFGNVDDLFRGLPHNRRTKMNVLLGQPKADDKHNTTHDTRNEYSAASLDLSSLETQFHSLKVRRYFPEPMYRGFIIDDHTGFLSSFHYAQEQRRIHSEPIFKKETNVSKTGIIRNGSSNNSLLKKFNQWFDTVWIYSSIPLYPPPVIVLDCDGTLFNTENVNLRSWRKILKEYDMEFDERRIKRLIREGISSDDVAEILEIPSERQKDIVQAKRDTYKKEILSQSNGIIFPGVIETIRELVNRGYLLLIASQTSQEIVEHLIAIHDLGGMFGRIYSGDAPVKKPSGEIIRKMSLDVDKSLDQFVMIGDSKMDYQTATSAKTPFIFINHLGINSISIHDVCLKITGFRELLDIFL